MPIHQYSDIYLEDIYKYFDLCNVAVEWMNKEKEEDYQQNALPSIVCKSTPAVCLLSICLVVGAWI